MTELLFYHLQDTTVEAVLPPLLEKSLERGWRVVVEAGSDERVAALDAHLWTYREDSFLPHAPSAVPDADRQPIILTAGPGNPNAAQVRFQIDSVTLPEDATSYLRLVLMFSDNDAEAVAQARATWTEAKARGLSVTYHQATADGWQRRQ